LKLAKTVADKAMNRIAVLELRREDRATKIIGRFFATGE